MLLSRSRLSESQLWQLQKEAYNRLGVESWAGERVPFHITNNSRIAAQYADIICAAFPNRFFTILELGSGCGKFAYLLIQELLFRNVCRFQYILTDASEKNVSYCLDHPLNQRLIEENILKINVLDPVKEDLPIAEIVIANYFFDSIPHDLFQIKHGKLYDCIVSVYGTNFADLKMTYEYEISRDLYPDFPEATRILKTYSHLLGPTPFSFPIGALKVIQRLQKRDEPFLMLAADKGAWQDDEVRGMALTPTFHGSAFSFSVNFHAIKHYMMECGGAALFSGSEGFVVALLSNQSVSNSAFGAHKFGPLKKEILYPLPDQNSENLSCQKTSFSSGFGTEIFDLLEDAKWDPTLFFFFFDTIEAAFDEWKGKERWMEGMRRICGRFFPLFQEETLFLERLGLFFQKIGEKNEADALFEKAARCKILKSEECWIEKEIYQGFENVLQIGDFGGVAEAISKVHPVQYVQMGWGDAMDALGVFDTIFLFPPKLSRQKEKPQWIRQIEEQFSLTQMRYADSDLETFLNSLAPEINPNQILLFFHELERQSQISKEQLEKIAKRFNLEASLLEKDHFFETLLNCLKRHMKQGSILKAFLPGISSYDDPRFFDEILVDPYLECEEKTELRGMWLVIKRVRGMSSTS